MSRSDDASDEAEKTVDNDDDDDDENEEEEEKEKKEEGQSGPPRFSRYTVYSLALSCVHPFPLFFRVCPPRSVCTDNANWKQKKTGSNERRQGTRVRFS